MQFRGVETCLMLEKTRELIQARDEAGTLNLTGDARWIAKSFIGVIFESRTCRSLSPTAKAVIDYINLPANKSVFIKLCFYSGFTMVTTPTSKTATKITAYSKIAAFTACHGCNNIDDVVSLAGQSDATNCWSTLDWVEVSRALAKHAQGTAYVLLGQSVLATSMWSTTEKPALIANAAVKKIKLWEIDTTEKFVAKSNIKG
ncbi:hypothetical protein C8J56DRAFT_923671 [Mycena floridula]|nr:hypothetical protein C8J56DRAFT_923671 [Mycena floridula]